MSIHCDTALEGGKEGDLGSRGLGMPGPCEHGKKQHVDACFVINFRLVTKHDVAGSEAERFASSLEEGDQYALFKFCERQYLKRYMISFLGKVYVFY